MLRYFAENGIELAITKEDREILTNVVDFVSMSYYMSICETADPARKVSDAGYLLGGVRNPPWRLGRVPRGADTHRVTLA